MISSEEEQAYQVARYALLWIMSAFRPLSPPEMFSALFWSGIEEELTLEVLLRVCHNMVIVDHELHVLRLNHLSVREYFEKHHFSEAEGHILASEAFLSHWQLDLALSDGAGHENAKSAIAQYLLIHWPFHTQKSEQATKDPPSNRTLVRFLGENGFATPSFREWRRAAIASMNNMPPRERYQCKFYRFAKPTESEPPSPLPLASLFGFSRYYEHILPLYPKGFANSRNKQGETVLMLAAREAHNALVRILVENGADINTNIPMPHNDYTTALQAAAVGGHFDTVQLLLQCGADINAEGGRHASALQAGAYFGHEEVVRLLHINGGTTKLGKGRFGYALHAAAYAGSEKIVRYLLEAGDDVNEFAGKYGTPLAAAVYKGHSQMIGILLEKGADINKNIGAFGSAFHLACLWGNESIVTALLEAGANLSAIDQSGRIPLHDAVTKGQKHLLPLLIRSSKDPRAMDDNGWTALDEATWRGQDDIVKIFANHGIYAGQIPDDCILRSKDRPTLVKSALELAFHDMRYEESWFEYALPIIRFSFFYLQRIDIAHRACQEISARWGWVCDSCRKTCDGEPQFVCTTCHSTDLCGECFESREKDGLALPTCILEHQYIPVDLEICGLDLWGWLKETEDVFDSILEFRKHPLHPQQTPIVRQTSERF